MSEIVLITFDGITVSLVNDKGMVVATSLAVSGKVGNQAPSSQNQPWSGPLPEGEYFIDPTEIDWNDDFLEYWAWGDSWGRGRVSLHPADETELFGRSGFFLHGSQNGNGYGSAGCIDLNENDQRILTLIQRNGASRIRVVVDYRQTRDRLENGPHPAFSECFPAHTPIVVSLSATRPIADIRVGDTVLAFDPSADLGRGALVPRRVARLYRNTTDTWIRLRWTEDGEARELVATPGHHRLDRFGNFPPLETMIANGRATVVLASGALAEVTAERIAFSAAGQGGPGAGLRAAARGRQPRRQRLLRSHHHRPALPATDRLLRVAGARMIGGAHAS